MDATVRRLWTKSKRRWVHQKRIDALVSTKTVESLGIDFVAFQKGSLAAPPRLKFPGFAHRHFIRIVAAHLFSNHLPNHT